jgi:glyoxylase-like metal-dependent hydrolase (beta-lactamase superfamily II)
MTRLFWLSNLVVVAAVSAAVAQAQRDPVVIGLQSVTDNLYVITGGLGPAGAAGGISGNTTVFVADQGIVLVDTKLPGFGKEILAKVRSITSRPVTTIINTHSHADHTSGNVEMPGSITHIAHQNTRANMARMDVFKGDNSSFLPSKMFTDRLTLFSGRDRVDLYYFGPGHTNGDAVVVFPRLRAAVFGDLFARKGVPGVDAANGGSALAFPDTLAKAVSGLKEVDTVITGHANTPAGRGGTFLPTSPVMTWSDLREYTEFTRDLVAAARAAAASGQSVEEAIKTLQLPQKYAGYEMTNVGTLVRRVYEELQ